MDFQYFKKAGIEMIDYIADYRDSIRERRVIPKEKPGFMRAHVLLKAPDDEAKWEELMQDVENVIMPGLSHWMHPHFHSFFPTGGSFISVLGVMLTGAIGCTASKWQSSPASTELEIIILDWLCKLFGLPEKFLLDKEGSKGGGGLQGSASECCLMNLFAAQRIALKKLKEQQPSKNDHEILASLRAYCSKEAHSSVEKACLIAMVKLRIIETDENYRFRGSKLEEAVKEDLDKGHVPFFVVATLGTTACASVDKFTEIGPICQKYDLWFHVDGAYAASALICPEFQHLTDGIEYASSISMNPSKWLLMHFDCSAMWIEDRVQFVDALTVDPTVIRVYPGSKIIDYCHWGTTYRRRFRSLKMWMTIRKYGVEAMQEYIRNHVRLAKRFEELIISDGRFEVKNVVKFGLVCFRLKGPNNATAQLLSALDATGKIYMCPASLGDCYVIRFCVSYEYATEEDIIYAHKIIISVTDELKLGSSQSVSKENNTI